MTIEMTLFKQILECAMLAAGEPLSLERLQQLFIESEEKPSLAEIRDVLSVLNTDCESRGLVIKEVASGFCLQIQPRLQSWISRLWEKRPPRYSRALLETLALIAYRQPITRAEIEDIRAVSISSSIFKTLMEREWIHVSGHKEVPGKPALYATTQQFLDYFNLKNLEELPALPDLESTLKVFEEASKITETSEISMTETETKIEKIEIAETTEEILEAQEIQELHQQENTEILEVLENIEDITSAEAIKA